jgi:hypothetical protein
MGYPYGEVKTLYLFGLLFYNQEDYSSARVRLEVTLDICSRLGERLYAAHIQQLHPECLLKLEAHFVSPVSPGGRAESGLPVRNMKRARDVGAKLTT